jgi:hypothetical protein
MPEAPLHLDDGAVLREDDVRPSGEVHDVNPESVAEAVKGLPDGDLGLSVLASNAGHDLGPLCLRERIGHVQSLFD